MRVSTCIKVSIRRGETHYIAECLELPVVTQGRTLDETLANLREAVSLFLEGEDLSTFGLADGLSLFILFEAPLADAA